jgi:CO/xanthine dehydrogenase FAD-binding subunit
MITQYNRPQTLEEALKLLSKPNTRPLGGGTVLSQLKDDTFSVVDLQSIGLDTYRQSGNNLEIGATVTLQKLLESPSIFESIKKAIRLETPLNLRTLGTIAGSMVACDGRSPFAAIMLAMDAKCNLAGDKKTSIPFGDLLANRGEFLRGKLITSIVIPVNVKPAFEFVARTPADKPIISAALANWPSGRTRLVLGGWGPAPTLAMDGNEPGGLKEAARNAAMGAVDDWASSDYRMDVAGILAERCRDALESS